MGMKNLPDWQAGPLAGLLAGVTSTLAQLALWLLLTDALPSILWRDGRLAAAIVLGEGVLPPPASFDAWIMLVASLVHFLLSAAYGLVFAPFVTRVPGRLFRWLTGGLLGALLFFVNMYGFTWFFPWFVAARDGITLAAHVVFGVSVAYGLEMFGRK